jgi:hypothetical protein
MTDSDEAEHRSRWAVSPLEAVIWAALAVLAVLSAVLGWGYVFDISSNPALPTTATPVWPVIVVFGVGAFLVKHLRKPQADGSADEEAETDPFFSRK